MVKRGCFFVLTWFLCSLNLLQSTQKNNFIDRGIQGPILASFSIIGGEIKFQDVGASFAWRVDLPNSSYSLYNWSPDGCNLLLRGTNWAVLPIVKSQIESLPSSSPVGDLHASVGKPIWTLDSQSLTFSIQPTPKDTTRIYLMNLRTQATELVLSIDGSGQAVKWLSERDLVYAIGTSLMRFNTVSKRSEVYGSLSSNPSGWELPFYTLAQSQDGKILSRFYDQNSVSHNSDTEGMVAHPNPGFDLYFLEQNEIKHVDVSRQLLQTLQWSPSGHWIVVSTYAPYNSATDEFNGIYIYDVQSDSLEKLDRFGSFAASEFGPYIPSWSPDEQWLALNTSSGYVMYNLNNQSQIELDKQFDGLDLTLSWSPVMHYNKSQCE